MNTFVLMTAMPPTKGHLALIEFASLTNDWVRVIVCTQPSEPFAHERFRALSDATREFGNVAVYHLNREMSQDASTPEFWKMWKTIMVAHGMTKYDTLVSSESYGQKVADLFGAKFMPYDPARELQKIKATDVRKYPAANMANIIPEFQENLIRTVTFFGAESVGKTTLSKAVANIVNGHWRFEYARPFLEMVGAQVTDSKMSDIFDGQEAIQKQGQTLRDKPFVIQDTDLFSTIGYWEMWKGEWAGHEWINRAQSLKSDLYIILSQNIPFEEDQLRYGGGKRESTDQYWIDLCEREGLNYVVVNEGGDKQKRITTAMTKTLEVSLEHTKALREYERKHNG